MHCSHQSSFPQWIEPQLSFFDKSSGKIFVAVKFGFNDLLHFCFRKFLIRDFPENLPHLRSYKRKLLVHDLRQLPI